MTLELVYFAWVRERIGIPRETVETEAATVADLRAIRVAADQELAGFDTPLSGVRELAFFPPMTGG
jgi:molybdopterin synthase sulfur carrier subunit